MDIAIEIEKILFCEEGTQTFVSVICEKLEKYYGFSCWCHYTRQNRDTGKITLRKECNRCAIDVKGARKKMS